MLVNTALVFRLTASVLGKSELVFRLTAFVFRLTTSVLGKSGADLGNKAFVFPYRVLPAFTLFRFQENRPTLNRLDLQNSRFDPRIVFGG